MFVRSRSAFLPPSGLPGFLSVAFSSCPIAGICLSLRFSRAAVNLRRTACALSLVVGLAGTALPVPVQAQISAHVGTATTAVYHGSNGGEGLALDAAGDLFTGFNASVGIYKSTYSNGTYTTASIGGTQDDFFGVAVDATGTIYAADESKGSIYRIVYASGAYAFTQIITGLGTTAGVAVDGYGNVYTNNYSNTLYKYTLSGGVYTQHVIASNFSTTRNLAIDASGVIYQADQSANKVRIFIPSGPVATTTSYTEGTALACTDGCAGVAVKNGIVYIGDGSSLLKETPNGTGGYSTLTVSTSYGAIRGMGVDASGNVFVSDLNNDSLSKTTTALPDFGSVAVGITSAAQPVSFVIDSNTGSTALGVPKVLTQGVAAQDFNLSTNDCTGAPSAGTTCIIQVTFSPKAAGERYGAVELTDASGNVLATALIQGNGTAPLATQTPGTISTVAGGGTAGVLLPGIQSVVVDPAGNLFTASAGNNTVNRISGSTAAAYGSGFADPVGLALDGAGNLYVSEYDAGDVKVVNAATGATSVVNGATGLGNPNAIVVDGSGNLYVAEYAANAVVKITPAGVVSTVAGTGTAGYNGDSIQALTAQLNQPRGLGLDAAGNVYIGDTGNGRVRKVTVGSGVITTVAGNGGTGFSGDGSAATAASLSGPRGQIVVDAGGDIFFADAGNNRIREITAASGLISTVAGSANITLLDGVAATASGLNVPLGLALDGAGNFYIGDNGNARLREVTANANPIGFGSVAVGTVGSQISTLNNLGNAPLAFPLPGAGTNPGVSAGFANSNASTCPQQSVGSGAGTLAAGTSCTDVIYFTPLAAMTYSGSEITTDNSLNLTSIQTVALGGTGGLGLPVVTVSTFAGTSGATVTLAATISFGGVAPTGAVTFSVDSTTLPGAVTCSVISFTETCITSYTLPTVTATATANITVSQAADSNYNTTSGNGMLTEVAAGSRAPATSVGAVSPAQTATIVIANGGIPSQILVTTQGVTGLDFAYIGGSTLPGACSTSIVYVSGQSCTVTYSFKPLVPGMRFGGINLVSANGTVLGSTYLAGTSTGPQSVVYNGTQSTVLSGLPGDAFGIALDASGSVYLHGNGNLLKETPAGTVYTATTIGSGLSNSAGIAIDGNGNVFYADHDNARVLEEVLNPVTGVYVQTVAFTTPASDFGLTIDNSGTLYVGSGNLLLKAVPAGSGAYTVTTVRSTYNNIIGLAVDGSGNLYVGDGVANVLYKESLAGATYIQSTVATGLGNVNGVAVDAAGTVYAVADGSSTGVLRYRPNGASYTALAAVGSFGRTNGVALDRAGNLYVTDDGGGNSVGRIDVADPEILTFPSTIVGSRASAQIATLTNIGNVSLPISALAVNSGNFTLDIGSTTCSTATAVPAGGNCAVGVLFTPQTGGNPETGTFSITDSSLNVAANVHPVNLSGTAVYAIPAIGGISPGFGTGGSVLTLTGSNLLGSTSVNFGSAPAASFSVVSNTTITATAPSGAGVVDITATTPGGTSALSPADRFTYQASSAVSLSVNGIMAGSVAPTVVTATQTGSYGSASGTTVTFTLGSNVGGTLSAPLCTLGNGTCSVTYTPSGSLAIGAYPQALTANFNAGAQYTAATAASALVVGGSFSETSLFPFTVVGGAAPGSGQLNSSLIQGSDGYLYGTAYTGGISNYGVVFKVLSDGTEYQVLHQFQNTGDSGNPSSGVVEGTDSFLYGVTALTGTGNGAVYRIALDGTGFVLLHNFTAGENATGNLVQGTDGFLYGTTYRGGASSLGSIYRLNAGGSFTTLYSFTGGADGSEPYDAPVQAADGNFYGLTSDRSTGNGTAYMFLAPSATAGAITPTTIYSFTGGTDGSLPWAGLVQGADGQLYGTANHGGVNNGGTVFRLSTTGQFTLLKALSGDTGNTVYSQVSLFLGSDGNFYGSGECCDASGNGSVFQITPGGTFTLLHGFTGGGDGAAPNSILVQANNGNYFGMTSGQGANGGGTLFTLAPGPGQSAPVQLSTSAASVNPGDPFTLAYSVLNAYSQSMAQCFATNTAADLTGWVGVKAASAMAATFQATAPVKAGTFFYSLTCGGVESSRVAVNVAAIAATTATIFSVNALAGAPVTLTATETGAFGAASGGLVSFTLPGTSTLATCTLDNNGSCTVSFLPPATLAPGTYSGLLQASFAATGPYTATTASGNLTIVAGSYSAPVQPVGSISSPQTATIVISNAGTPRTVNVLTQGATGLDFGFVTGGSCSMNRAYLVGDSCTVAYTFAPLAPGQRMGGITLAAADGTLLGTAALSGTGTGPQAVFSSATATSAIGSGIAQPSGLWVDAAGNVYVTDYAAGTVKKMVAVNGTIPSSPSILTLASGLNGACGVAVDGVGNVYAGGALSGSVLKIPFSGSAYGAAVNLVSGNVGAPCGLTVDAAGNLYFVEQSGANQGIVEVLAQGGSIPGNPSYSEVASGLPDPQGVAVDAGGNLYVDTAGDDVVYKVPYAAGAYGTPTAIYTGAGPNFGLSIDGSGNLYLSPAGGSTPIVELLEVNGSIPANPTTINLGTGFGSPRAVAISGNGNLFVANFNNGQVTELDLADGPTLGFSATAVGATSTPQTATLLNQGNVALTLNSVTVTSNFTLGPAASTCASGTLAEAASCNVTASFAPTTSAGSLLAGAVIFKDDNRNAANTLQRVNLAGTVLQGVATVNVTSLTAAGGSNATLTATVSYGGAQPTGALTFTVNGGMAIPAACIANANSGSESCTATYPVSLAQNSYQILGTLASDANYGLATGSATLAVTQLSSMVTVPSVSVVYGTASTNLTASVAYTGTTAPTGAVSFAVSDGRATSLPATCTGTASPLTCAATLSTANLTVNIYTITATQAADARFTASTGIGKLPVTQALPTLGVAGLTIPYGSPTAALSASLLYPGPAAPTGVLSFTVDNGAAFAGSCANAAGSLACTATYPVVNLNAGSHTITVLLAADTNYNTVSGNGILTLATILPAINFTIPNHTYGDASFNVAAISTATGAFSYNVVSGPATIAGSTLSVTGAGPVTVQASQAADSNYVAATKTASFAVAPAPLALTASNATRVYGAANPAFTGSVTGAKYGDSFAQSFATIAVPASPVGTYSITPSATGTDYADYSVTAINGLLTVTQAPTVITLTSAAVNANPLQPVTLTAAVTSSTTGVPTGTVTFFDNGTALATVSLNIGVGTYSTAALAPGTTHSITVGYSGDTDFLPGASAFGAIVNVGTLDFTFTTVGPTSYTAAPGATATYKFAISPQFVTFAGSVNFTVSGLPSGATAVFSPSSLSATSGAQNVTLSVLTPVVTARSNSAPPGNPASRRLPLLALLLLPALGSRRFRRRLGTPLLTLVLLLGGLGAAATLTGCGTGPTGFLLQRPGTYTMTVNAASGSLQHTQTVTLTVQ